MAATDERLRDAFEALAARAGDHPQDLADLLHRRKRRRTVAATIAAASAAAMTVGIVALAVNVSGEDAPQYSVTPLLSATPTPSIVALAPSCHRDQLLESPRQLLPAPQSGDDGFVIPIKNVSRSTCELGAAPTGIASGHGLPDYRLQPFKAPGTVPAVLRPGMAAHLWVHIPTSCADPEPTPVNYHALAVNWPGSGEPPDGGINFIRGAQTMTTTCGIFLSDFYTGETTPQNSSQGTEPTFTVGYLPPGFQPVGDPDGASPPAEISRQAFQDDSPDGGQRSLSVEVLHGDAFSDVNAYAAANGHLRLTQIGGHPGAVGWNVPSHDGLHLAYLVVSDGLAVQVVERDSRAQPLSDAELSRVAASVQIS